MMEMTKQRKMLVGVLCLGLGGLAIDRFVIGSPESASADDVEVLVEAPPTLGPASVIPPTSEADSEVIKTLPSYASLTARLIQAQEDQASDPTSDSREDPFALPPEWQAQRSAPQTQIAQEADSDDAAHRFASKFRLDGTVRSSIDGKDEMLAVISGGKLDGLAIRVKQKIRIRNADGTDEVYTLIEVGPRYAVWRLDGSNEEITMRVAEVLSGE